MDRDRYDAPWQDVEIPDDVDRIPGMLTREECRYYMWLTRTRYRGRGAIVDLGPWLGLSTACLAAGLALSGQPGVVRAFDVFEWRHHYMPQHLPPSCRLALPEGADFMPRFEDNVAPWRDRVEVSKADLTDYRWSGGEIEMLIVDAAKSWKLLNGILQGFGHALIPGVSRVVFQDFRDAGCYWLPLVVDSRPDLWQQIETTVESTTATFVPRRPLLGEGGITEPYAQASFEVDQSVRILRERVRVDPPKTRRMMQRLLAGVLLLEAERATEEVLAGCDASARAGEVCKVREIALAALETGWNAYADGDFATALAVGERCARAVPGHVGALTLIARSARRARARDRARAAEEELVQSAPDKLAARIEDQLERGDLHAATHWIDAGLAASPRAPWLRLYQLDVARRRGEDDIDERLLPILAETGVDEPALVLGLRILAEFWNERRRFGEARRVLERIAAQHPTSAEPCLWLARAHEKLGDPDRAREAVRMAFDRVPDHPGRRDLESEFGIG